MYATNTTQDQILKVKYGPAFINLINGKTVQLDRIEQKKKVFTGKNWTQPKGMTTGGGIGARSGSAPTLPEANPTIQDDLVATCKKLYARVAIDRETMLAGRKSEQVFVDGTKHEMKSKATRYALDLNRQIYGDANGSLGLLSADPGTGTSFAITEATWNENFWMEGDTVQFYSDVAGVPTVARTGTYIISAVAPASRTITVTSAIDAGVLVGDHVVLNGNAGNEITGFTSHIDDQSSTIHGIDKSAFFRARGIYKDASSASISVDLMNQVCETMSNRSVEFPQAIFCNPVQWRLFSQLLEDAKIYYAKDSDKGKFGFGALEYVSPMGVLPVYSDRFCPKGKMYFENYDSFKLIMREDFGWFDDDGTILMREADKDSYEARYGGYCELICETDNANGVLDNLATS